LKKELLDINDNSELFHKSQASSLPTHGPTRASCFLLRRYFIFDSGMTVPYASLQPVTTGSSRRGKNPSPPSNNNKAGTNRAYSSTFGEKKTRKAHQRAFLRGAAKRGQSTESACPHRNAQKGNYTGTENAQKRAQKNDLHEAHNFLELKCQMKAPRAGASAASWQAQVSEMQR
jgi:hypothetical protein